MKKIALTLVLAATIALPAAAQSSEFGFIYGGTLRSEVEGKVVEGGNLDDSFSFDNNAVDLYWATDFNEDTRFKLRAGRIESIVSLPVALTDDNVARRDAMGDIEHVSGAVEYRFSEFYGTTGLFAGVGMYRAEANGETDTDYGFNAGVSGDFPINRRYGVILDATYHLTNLEFRPRYLTVGAGLRVRF